MAVKPIVSYGHPALRHIAEPVTEINDEILKTIQDLKDTLHNTQGIGLAAPQIGVEKQIFIVDLSYMNELKYKNNKVTLINPEIIFKSKKTVSDNEGCLSLMHVRGSVERSFKIKIKGLLPSGKPRVIETTGLFARVLQHEFDHLYGKLLIDYFNEVDLLKNTKFITQYLNNNRKILPEIME